MLGGQRTQKRENGSARMAVGFRQAHLLLGNHQTRDNNVMHAKPDLRVLFSACESIVPALVVTHKYLLLSLIHI